MRKRYNKGMNHTRDAWIARQQADQYRSRLTRKLMSAMRTETEGDKKRK